MKEKVKAKFIKRCSNIPYKQIEKEVLLLNLKDGNYFGLNQTGMIIWKMLDGTKKESDIITVLKKRFDLKEGVAKKHMGDFLRGLKKNNLIECISPQ